MLLVSGNCSNFRFFFSIIPPTVGVRAPCFTVSDSIITAASVLIRPIKLLASDAGMCRPTGVSVPVFHTFCLGNSLKSLAWSLSGCDFFKRERSLCFSRSLSHFLLFSRANLFKLLSPFFFSSFSFIDFQTPVFVCSWGPAVCL